MVKNYSALALILDTTFASVVSRSSLSTAFWMSVCMSARTSLMLELMTQSALMG